MLKKGKKSIIKIFGTKMRLLILEAKQVDGGREFVGQAGNGMIISGKCDKELNYK